MLAGLTCNMILQTFWSFTDPLSSEIWESYTIKCKDVIKELGTWNWCCMVCRSFLFLSYFGGTEINYRQETAVSRCFFQWQISVMTLYLMAFISVVKFTTVVQLNPSISNSCWNSIFQCPAVIGDGIETVATRDVISQNWWAERKMHIWADGQDMRGKIWSIQFHHL